MGGGNNVAVVLGKGDPYARPAFSFDFIAIEERGRRIAKSVNADNAPAASVVLLLMPVVFCPNKRVACVIVACAIAACAAKILCLQKLATTAAAVPGAAAPDTFVAATILSPQLLPSLQPA